MSKWGLEREGGEAGNTYIRTGRKDNRTAGQRRGRDEALRAFPLPAALTRKGQEDARLKVIASQFRFYLGG